MNIILTGGHSGIGLELTKRLLSEGHRLGLVIRNEKRKEEAIDAIGTSDNIDFFYADLSKQNEVRALANSIKSSWDTIDGLFNNAGVLLDKAMYSEQGNEMHFEINTLAPYFLSQELKPLLDAADNPFIVNTVTGGMHTKKSLDIADLKKPKKFVRLLGSYMNSKFALVLLMKHLSVQWPHIRIINVDPGPNKTKMTKGSGMPTWLKPISKLLFSKPTKGANKLYDGAFKAAFADTSGVYITGNKIQKLKYELGDAERAEMINVVKK